ncbi:MAG: restriction endonuclease subunit S [Anaerovibrio sp.]|uniref:restriction endonuclease subunit S n=1 Tax=Anaerovibrio sp. TaxID=1872532 RepID=UPI0025EF41A7|nr:restriction endonuclease subunit S [Anaerovibrio sp.]MCR5176822.1 restriction endonuclease subunit S [Anaerovibrio sp.]
MNTPKIRFKGFTDSWEQRKLGDICDFEKGRGLSREDLISDGKYQCILYGQLFTDYGMFIDEVKSSTNIKNNDVKLSETGDILIPRCSTAPEGIGRASVITKSNVILGFDINILKCKNKNKHDSEFVSLAINHHQKDLQTKVVGTMVRHLENKEIKDVYIELPQNANEQHKITKIFKNLDNLITLHQRKCDSLKQVKKYMLQKMFPKQGEKVPEIRFAGFTGDWEQRKYSDIAITRRGLTYKPDNIVSDGKRVLRSSNINEDTFEIHEDDVFVDENAVNIPYVKNGDILITSANGSSRLVGKHAIVRNITDNSMVHGGFMLLASSDEPEFLNALMSSQWYTRFINVYVAGGNGAIGNLNKSDLDGQIVSVPSRDEMKKIGDYFSNLDNLITLHQRKSDSLKEIKKFMLQNMFPRE